MSHFTEAQLEGVVGIEEAVEGLRSAFIDLAAGDAVVQGRIATAHQGLRINTMAAVIPSLECCGAKVYTALGSRFSFATLLFSTRDGRLLASFEAGALTRLRTAAVSVLAARLLARPGRSALAVFGTGVQAAGHVEAFARALPIDSIRVVGRAGAAEFAKRMESLTGIRVAAVDARTALREADLVVTATRSPTPLFEGSLLREGCTIVAVGSALPDASEIDPVVVSRCARIVVESEAAARHEAGDLILAHAAGVATWSKVRELGRLLADGKGGRESPSEIVMFESIGSALEDVAIASIAFARLRQLGRL